MRRWPTVAAVAYMANAADIQCVCSASRHVAFGYWWMSEQGGDGACPVLHFILALKSTAAVVLMLTTPKFHTVCGTAHWINVDVRLPSTSLNA